MRGLSGNAIHSVQDWIKINIILAIPVVNLVFMLLWGTDDTDLERKNFIIGKIISIIIIAIVGGIIGFIVH